MIRNSENMIKEIKQQMRGGEGEVTITHIFQQEELKGQSRLCARITLPSGASIGEHIHEQEEEIYYILSGIGIVVDGGIEQEVGPGDAVLTRDGASHSIRNHGDDLLDFIAVINLYE